MPKRKRLSEADVLSEDQKWSDQYPCVYRGGVTEIRQCPSCGGKKKNVAVHSCEKFGECTVLARRSKNADGKHTKVCISCDDRTADDGVAKKNRDGAILVGDAPIVDCVFFGKRTGTYHRADGSSVERFACDHAALPATTSKEECSFCTFRQSFNLPRGTAKAASCCSGGSCKTPQQLVQISEPELVLLDDPPARAPVLRKKAGRSCVVDAPEFVGTAFASRKRSRRLRNQLEGQRHAADRNHVGVTFNRMKSEMPVGNLLHNADLFLVCSGPSLNELDLQLLQSRGVVSMGINNASAHVKTNMMIHGDPTKKFHDSVWRDPSIMKFTPKTMLRRDVRTRSSDGSFSVYGKVMYMPNVVGYSRNSTFDPDNFLTEETISFGNGKQAQEKNGLPRVLSTLFSGIKMSWHLGARRIFLLGCDMNMRLDQAYAFEEEKSRGAVNGNNSSYRKIQKLLGLALPHFDSVGFQVFNCNPKSSLEVFPFMSFETAVRLATEGIEQVPNTRGWYVK